MRADDASGGEADVEAQAASTSATKAGDAIRIEKGMRRIRKLPRRRDGANHLRLAGMAWVRYMRAMTFAARPLDASL